MENNTPPSKLDETIKENLSNYDAKYDAGDWSRMERMLDATPKSITPKGSYNMAIIIGGIVLVAGFAIYKGVTSSKTTDITTEIPVAPIENKVETAPKPAPAIITNTVTTTPPIVKTEPVAVPEAKVTVPEVKIPLAVGTEKTKTEKKTKNVADDNDINKTQKATVMGNEPIFGDMIDSSKGIIHKTKEKESTKKAAVEKGSKSTVGLSNLFNLNADSLRKQKELMVKDTIQK